MLLLILHTEYLIPGLLLVFALGVVAYIAIVQYVIKLRDDRRKRKNKEL